MAPTVAIDAEQLRREVETAVASYLRRHSRLAPDVEVRDLTERDQYFPSMTTPFRGEIFLTVPRGPSVSKEELDGLIDLVVEGFDREEICGERLRAPTCSLRGVHLIPEDRRTITIGAWLELDVRL